MQTTVQQFITLKKKTVCREKGFFRIYSTSCCLRLEKGPQTIFDPQIEKSSDVFGLG